MRKVLSIIILSLVVAGAFGLPIAWTASNVFVTVDNLIAGANITLDKTSTTVTINGSAGGGACDVGAGTNSWACGTNATAAGLRGTSLGDTAVASATNTVALGETSTASSSGGIAIGRASSATNSDGIAIGRAATATAIESISIGPGADAITTDSIVIGANAGTTAGGTANIVIGEQAVGNTGVDSLIVGRGAVGIAGSSGNNQMIFGSSTAAYTDGYFGRGKTQTVGGHYTFHTTDVTGTDAVAGNLVIQPGKGTSTGASGKYIVRTGYGYATGAVAHDPHDRFVIVPNAKPLVDNTATGFVTISVGSSAGGVIAYSIRAINTSDAAQTCSGQITYSAVTNLAGTLALTTSPSDSSGDLCGVKAVTTGTLTAVLTSTNDGSAFTLRVTADTSLTSLNDFVIEYTITSFFAIVNGSITPL